MIKTAILAVSFGTSYEQTRKLTIDRFEEDLAVSFEECKVYRAWTSNMIIKKLLERDGIKIDDVGKALDKIRTDGFDQVIVQPSHILEGFEYEKILSTLKKCKNEFSSLRLGRSLLYNGGSSCDEVATAIEEMFPCVRKSEALLLIGHGTGHNTDSVYFQLEQKFIERGHKNFFVGTIEGGQGLERVQEKLLDEKYNKVWLVPFLIVAGDHVAKDIAGDRPDSCRQRLSRAGLDVECVLRGLGEYREIRKILVQRAKMAEKI